MSNLQPMSTHYDYQGSCRIWKGHTCLEKNRLFYIKFQRAARHNTTTIGLVQNQNLTYLNTISTTSANCAVNLNFIAVVVVVVVGGVKWNVWEIFFVCLLINLKFIVGHNFVCSQNTITIGINKAMEYNAGQVWVLAHFIC